MTQAGLLTRKANKAAEADQEAARDALYESFLAKAEPIAKQLIAHRDGKHGNLGRVTDDHVYQAAVITIAFFGAAANCDLHKKLTKLELHILAATALDRARRAQARASAKLSELVV